MLVKRLPPKQTDQTLIKKHGITIKKKNDIKRDKKYDTLKKFEKNKTLKIKILVPGSPIVVKQTSQMLIDRSG